jgi:hypothetical protein
MAETAPRRMVSRAEYVLVESALSSLKLIDAATLFG